MVSMPFLLLLPLNWHKENTAETVELANEIKAFAAVDCKFMLPLSMDVIPIVFVF